MATIFEERPKGAATREFGPEVTNRVAAKAVVRLLSAWDLDNASAARLVGVGDRTWSRMKSETWTGELNQDQRMRVSALVGLYQGLHVYFSDELADRWVRMENAGPLFGGKSPLSIMLEGGLPAILETRDYIDAVRGGL